MKRALEQEEEMMEGRIYHVAKSGNDRNPGTQERPFLTIQKAADMAEAGDCAVVHQGEYREWVKPRNGGLSCGCPVTCQAALGHGDVEHSLYLQNRKRF